MGQGIRPYEFVRDIPRTLEYRWRHYLRNSHLRQGSFLTLFSRVNSIHSEYDLLKIWEKKSLDLATNDFSSDIATCSDPGVLSHIS